MFFGDLYPYALCSFFALGVYFLYGGLCRAGASDAISDFVFPYLRKIKQDGIAN